VLSSTPLRAGLPAEALKSLGEQVPHPSDSAAPPNTPPSRRTSWRTPMLNDETIRLDGAIRMAPR
jgi:hypothetical protein